jgi:hypothetical protein
MRGGSAGNHIKWKNPNSVNLFNEYLNFNFFLRQNKRIFLEVRPAGSNDFQTCGHGPQFFVSTGGYGQRAAKCHDELLTSTPHPNCQYFMQVPFSLEEQWIQLT